MIKINFEVLYCSSVLSFIFVDEINDLIISLTEGNPQLIDRLWQYSTDEFYTYLKTIKRVFPDKLLKQREQLVVEQ